MEECDRGSTSPACGWDGVVTPTHHQTITIPTYILKKYINIPVSQSTIWRNELTLSERERERETNGKFPGAARSALET